jgi:hypothetical protein
MARVTLYKNGESMSFEDSGSGNIDLYIRNGWLPAGAGPNAAAEAAARIQPQMQAFGQAFAGAISNVFGGSKSYGSSSPGSSSGSYVAPIFAAAPLVDPRAARAQEYANFTGWDNDPDVRQLQVRDLQIYIDTGLWNTPEQQHLHDLAEQIRKSKNPAYGGLPNGPADKSAADWIFPANTTPNANNLETGIDNTVLDTSKWGGYAKVGIGAFFLIFLMSMFRRW